ncbi:REP-associated tyrosine transposase [Lyngbya aestuarii]|uniref:REP-associated tyrosine transposase n=1 Tax=Lyngbya aestuarii TaxID=118322 RepID=UPI00403DF6D3
MPYHTYLVTFCTWERLVLSPPARQVVMNACQFFEGQRYQIFAGVIMPDHVHLLIQPWSKEEGTLWTIGSILHSIKSYSAKQIPKVMPHIGKIWQDGRHERLILSNQHFQAAWEYIRQNPIKADISEASSIYPFFWQQSN